MGWVSPYLCDHCGIAYLENGSFDANWLDNGDRVCTECYEEHHGDTIGKVRA